jgi:hypothetical protein
MRRDLIKKKQVISMIVCIRIVVMRRDLIKKKQYFSTLLQLNYQYSKI